MSRASNRLLFPLVALLLCGPGEAGAADEFQRHLAQGVALYKKELYGQAIAEFQSAYGLRPVPRLLYNMAQAYRKMGDAKNALAFYELDLQKDLDQTPAERAEVSFRIEEMKAHLAQQDRPAGAEPAAARKVPALPEGAAQAPSVAAVGTPIRAEPEAKRPRRLPPWPQLTLIGGGAVLLIIGAGLGGAALADADQVQRANPDGTFNAGLFQQGRSLNTAAITFDVVAALALAGGGAWTIWWYLHGRRASPGVAAASVPAGSGWHLGGGF